MRFLSINLNSKSLYRVLRARASAGIFAEDETQRFHSIPLAATLRNDIPGSLRFIAMTELGEEHYPAWEQALYSVMTGGRERTESQYRELLAAAGFQLNRIVQTPSPFCVIEAVRA
jgi:hypothetical protein